MTHSDAVVAAVGAGVLGACVGSFLNVVMWRVPRGESVIRPASRCPRCGQALRSFDNVPIVSWLLLRGRCRSCGDPISVRYPLVESLTAVTFATVTLLLALASAWRLVPGALALSAGAIAQGAIVRDHGVMHRRVTVVTVAIVTVALLAGVVAR